jgi:DNA-binding transcriptional LysR family regulator
MKSIFFKNSKDIKQVKKMNIENIEAFVYVFHLGSFNKAAEALYLTQPSVSARIQSLEREFNAKLFNREGKQISLTEKGKHFLPYAQNILESYREAKFNMRQQELNHNELSIACSLSVSNYIIPEILPIFRQTFPDVVVKILTGHSDDVLKKVINKEVDFGIARAVSHPKIESFLFHTDPVSPVVPSGHHFLQYSSKVTFEQISSEPLIFFDHGSIDWLMVHGLFESNNLKPNIITEVDSMEAAKRMVLKGIGISFLPELCIQDELRKGELHRIIMSTSVQIARKIDLIYLKGTQAPFFDFFTQFINFQTKRLSLIS